jgi:hypothetical protein
MQDSNSEYTIDEAHNQNTKPPPVWIINKVVVISTLVKRFHWLRFIIAVQPLSKYNRKCTITPNRFNKNSNWLLMCSKLLSDWKWMIIVYHQVNNV